MRPFRAWWGLPVALLALAVLAAGAHSVRADPPPALTLSNADNGATVSATVGETVLLKLDSGFSWNVSLDNPAMMFRPPVALAAGVQGDWEIIGPGQVTISATGDPACRQATPACAAPSQTWSATVSVAGTLHSLTTADNGATVSANVGDYVRLDVAPLLTQNPQSSNTAVLAPVQIGLYNGVLLQALAPGQATLTATVNPTCYPKCMIASTMFSVTINVAGQAAPSSPASPPSNGSVQYATGWNLVGVPDGTTLPVDAFLWQPRQGSYLAVPAGQPLQGGDGYWAFFTSATTVPISGGRPSAVIDAPAGGWVMIGDPSATVPVVVNGADAVFTWDPVTGQYTRTNALGPGQGGWATRATAGQIVISPAP